LGVLSRSLPLILGLPKTLRRYDRVTFLSAKRDWNRFFDHWVAQLTGYEGIRVIPNGTDPSPTRGSVEDFRSKYGLGQGLNLLCVANYGPRKNQELAIRAFRKARLKDSTLVLIGSEFNDYVRKIKLIDEQLQTDYPEGRVVFIEKLDRLSTMASYAACDVFLLAATAETQPISLLEAMAAGMAFISTDTGCVSEMPGGVIANSEDELAAAIVSLEDDTKRNALGAEGRQAVLDYFSKEKVLDAQERMIRELLDADRGV
jgi:glycosyltransferase involved in cell wall biosynthesis